MPLLGKDGDTADMFYDMMEAEVSKYNKGALSTLRHRDSGRRRRRLRLAKRKGEVALLEAQMQEFTRMIM